MSTPAATYALDPTLARRLAGSGFRRADTARDERDAEPGEALERFLRNLAGWLPPGRERASRIAAFDRQIGIHAAELRVVSDEQLVSTFYQHQRSLKHAGKSETPSHMAAVFACVGEASRRRLGMWPHPVQFTGARVLLSGQLAEMQTGEGKTLVAALAATAMAGSGAMVHVISTNDYLARRDCEEMSPLFEFFGLGASHVIEGMEPDERREAYRHSICYVSGKELVFDYLKDRLAGHGAVSANVTRLRDLWSGGMSKRPETEPLIPALHFAIVDEADSVMIDEARTPMILSREAEGVHESALLEWAMAAAHALEEGVHFRFGEHRDIDLMANALEACPAMPEGLRPAWYAASWRRLIVRQALTARHLYVKDQQYIISDEGKVQIVDESTGRVMADRSWEQGLHQLIETKEGLELTQGRETLARMTFQRFFRRYFLLSGLTGTAAEAAREFWEVYRLKVRRIPPNRPSQRRSLGARCVPDNAAKWQAIVDDALAAAGRGQPVLIGTRSVEASEHVAEALARRSIDHVVLNARQDAQEADIVASAGESGRITVATNMAGRGTDIKLTEAARVGGGLHVVLTEFHESPRVDRQLLGRCGRQGDPGTTSAIVSAEDALFKELPLPLRTWLRSGSEFVRSRGLGIARQWAQSRCERRALRARMQTLKQDRELHRLIGFAGKVL